MTTFGLFLCVIAAIWASVGVGYLAYSVIKDYRKPKFNEEEFKLMVERGTKAWAHVPDSAKWVDELRGNKE